MRRIDGGGRDKSPTSRQAEAVVTGLLYMGDAIVGVAHVLDEVQDTLSLIQQDAVYRDRSVR